MDTSMLLEAGDAITESVPMKVSNTYIFKPSFRDRLVLMTKVIHVLFLYTPTKKV